MSGDWWYRGRRNHIHYIHKVANLKRKKGVTMNIYLVMKRVQEKDSRSNKWYDKGTYPVSAHYDFESATDVLLKEYQFVRKKKNVLDVDYKDGCEGTALSYDFTDIQYGIKYNIEKWITFVEVKEKEIEKHE